MTYEDWKKSDKYKQINEIVNKLMKVNMDLTTDETPIERHFVLTYLATHFKQFCEVEMDIQHGEAIKKSKYGSVEVFMGNVMGTIHRNFAEDEPIFKEAFAKAIAEKRNAQD